MSKLDKSMDRFLKALDRVDATVNRRLQRTRAVDSLEQELVALRQDRTRLAQELDNMKAETKALEGVTDEVAARLDTAIRDIRAVLEH